MNLSALASSLNYALTISGWTTVVEDNYPDFQQLACRNLSGPLGMFTRLDLLIVTPELNPAEADGACLSFLFYADLVKVDDMRMTGRMIRQDGSCALRSCSESVLDVANIGVRSPSMRISIRPKHHKVTFDDVNHPVYPAFLVAIEYWVSREEMSRAEQCLAGTMEMGGCHDR